MSEQDRDLAQMGDEESLRHRGRHALVQEAINEVTADGEGKDRDEIVRQLSVALQVRGIGPQPPRWLEAVAAEASQGRLYVEDPSAADPSLVDIPTVDPAVAEDTTIERRRDSRPADTST